MSILENQDCFYDTGDGLINAYHAILTDDGETPVIGVLVSKADNNIIMFTGTKLLVFSDTEKKAFITAGEIVLDAVRKNDTEKLREFSDIKASKLSEAEKTVCLAGKTLSEICLGSDSNSDDLAAIIAGTNEIALIVTNLNASLYGEILANEAVAVMRQKTNIQGTSAVSAPFVRGTLTIMPHWTIEPEHTEEIEEFVKNISSAYGGSVWNEKKNTADKVVHFNSKENPVTYRYYVDFKDDIDT